VRMIYVHSTPFDVLRHAILEVSQRTLAYGMRWTTRRSSAATGRMQGTMRVRMGCSGDVSTIAVIVSTELPNMVGEC